MQTFIYFDVMLSYNETWPVYKHTTLWQPNLPSMQTTIASFTLALILFETLKPTQPQRNEDLFGTKIQILDFLHTYHQDYKTIVYSVQRCLIRWSPGSQVEPQPSSYICMSIYCSHCHGHLDISRYVRGPCLQTLCVPHHAGFVELQMQTQTQSVLHAKHVWLSIVCECVHIKVCT